VDIGSSFESFDTDDCSADRSRDQLRSLVMLFRFSEGHEGSDGCQGGGSDGEYIWGSSRENIGRYSFGCLSKGFSFCCLERVFISSGER
jgi:hypothetical protein